MVRAATSFILFLLTAQVGSETVDVKDLGIVDLRTFECRDIIRSTLIQRVCYDKAQRDMIVGIKGSHDHYCELPVRTFEGLVRQHRADVGLGDRRAIHPGVAVEPPHGLAAAD